MGIRDDIHEDVHISDAIEALLRDMNREEAEFLGEGVEGYAARLDNGWVVKVTTSTYEVASALYLLENPDDDMVSVYAVACCGDGIYLVVREDIADLDLVDSQENMDDRMIETHLKWRTGRRDKNAFHAWVDNLDSAGDPIAPMLRELWICMEYMESRNIDAGDINFSNMGRNSMGTMVMRDLGGCNPPLNDIRRANNMQPGDVVLREPVPALAYK